MIEALIYDFDGTLSDTYPVATDVMLQMMAENGKKGDYNEVYALLKVSFGHASRVLLGEDPALSKAFGRRAAEAAATRCAPVADAARVLAFGKAHGVRNFIYTHSGPEVTENLKRWGMFDNVTFVLDNTRKFPRKPDPAALLYLTERFSIDPAKAVMVGDRDIDVDVGHNAGMRGCLFDEGGYYPGVAAEFRVGKLREIESIIRKENGEN